MIFEKIGGIWLLLTSLFLSFTLIGAYSYFTSQTQINSNTLSFGTLMLNMKPSGDNNSLTAVWSQSNLAPGDDVSGNFDVSNVGSVDAHALGLRFANSGYNSANNPALPNRLRLTSLSYDGQQLITAIETALTNDQPLATVSGVTVTANASNGLVSLDSDSDNHLSLGELDNNELLIESPTTLNGLTHSTQAGVEVGLHFVPGSDDNIYQGDSVVTAITGTLYQVAP